MAEARIEGKAATLEAAARHGAELLAQARLPVVAGLGADVAGASAAILLAERLRGAYDHLRSREIFVDLDVVRQAGAMVTTPYVARQHADVLLFIGDDITAIWPDLPERLKLASPPALALAPAARTLVWIAPPHGAAIAGVAMETLDADDLDAALAALRARVAGRPLALDATATARLDKIAAILNAAHFGVAIWGPRLLNSLAVEMIVGLLIDLNKTTRFSGLPLGSPDNAQGVVQTSGWTTGFPVRTGFGRAFPEHDSWRFDAVRLIASGEADAALWISAYDAAPPPWPQRIPLVALTPAGTRFASDPAVQIEVGRPGLDHDGAEYARDVGALVAREASRRSDTPSVAAVVAAIAAALPDDAGGAV